VDLPDGHAADDPEQVYVTDMEPFCVTPAMSVRQVIARIDQGGEGLALVVGGRRRLLATVTDGDIRRALMAGSDLEAPIERLLHGGIGPGRVQPITAPLGTSPVKLLRLMGEHVIRHVPLLDEAGDLAGLALLSRFVHRRDLPLRAVIMAGGLGTRLRPLTETTPKPMLPVGDRPLLQRTIEQLGQAGIRTISITTHYQAEKIKRHIGDGSSFGAVVQYSHENEPLGTAGALRRLAIPDGEPLLVINGDVLTTVNYRAMLDYHLEHGAELTMGVRRYAMEVPYGVVECDGAAVRKLREKPEVGFFVNAGVYLVEPRLCREIPENRHYDMTDLIDGLVARGRRVVSFPIHEYWLDIGRIDDYERVQLDVSAGKVGPR
jgi:dTDP-glucose pyrophosphorylase/CBS domain-containing protein